MAKRLTKILSAIMLIIMSTGLFAGCGDGIKEKPVDDMIELHTWFFTSGLPNNAILVKYTNESAVFEIITDNGNLWFEGPESAKILEVKPNCTVYWSFYDESEKTIEETFVEIILRQDSKIIGYAVIEINKAAENSLDYNANVLRSALFPKVRGQYQEISEEYLKTAIEKVKSDENR